jgi:hypothetical protein
MFTREFTHAGSNTRVTVLLNPHGWELRQENAEGVVQSTFYRDWHRVERALRTMGLEEPFAAIQTDDDHRKPH